jgi:hypothetical protein
VSNVVNSAGNGTMSGYLQSLSLQNLSLQNLSDAVRADPARAGVRTRAGVPAKGDVVEDR